VDKVIAVDVYPPLEKDDPWIDPVSAIMGFQLPFGLFSASTGSKMPSMLSSIWRGFRVMAWYLHEERLAAHPPDVLLRPEVDGFGSLDFSDVEGPYLAGLNEAQRRLPEIKMLFEDSATRSSA
jgi:predicted acylesterase/phospholipase RssA